MFGPDDLPIAVNCDAVYYLEKYDCTALNQMGRSTTIHRQINRGRSESVAIAVSNSDKKSFKKRISKTVKSELDLNITFSKIDRAKRLWLVHSSICLRSSGELTSVKLGPFHSKNVVGINCEPTFSIRSNEKLGRGSFLVDKRSVISFFGDKYNDQIKTERGQFYYADLQYSKTGYAFNRVKEGTASGSQLTRKWRFFLCRRMVKVYSEVEKAIVLVPFVGWATTTNLKHLRKKDAAGLESALSFNNALSKDGPKRGSFSRYVLQENHLNDHDVNIMKADDFDKDSPAALLSFLNSSNAADLSPIGLLVKRIEAKLKEAKAEQNVALAQLGLGESEIHSLKQDIAYGEAEIVKMNNEIAMSKRSLQTHLDKAEERKQRSIRATEIAERTASILSAKQLQLLEFKKKIVGDQNIERKDYASSWRKSGIVVDELYYKKGSSSSKVRASVYPSVVSDPEYSLTEIELHTTKPIPMVFGTEHMQHQDKPVSGPHKMKIKKHGHSVAASIKMLTPWSVVGFTRHGKMKSYPHTEICANLRGANELQRLAVRSWMDGFDSETYVCTGSLSDSASRAFRQNNPKALVYAALSYLKSVNLDDSWGSGAKHFPKVKDILPYKEPNTENTEDLSIVDSYFISDCGRYIRYKAKLYEAVSASDGMSLGRRITERIFTSSYDLMTSRPIGAQ